VQLQPADEQQLGLRVEVGLVVVGGEELHRLAERHGLQAAQRELGELVHLDELVEELGPALGGQVQVLRLGDLLAAEGDLVLERVALLEVLELLVGEQVVRPDVVQQGALLLEVVDQLLVLLQQQVVLLKALLGLHVVLVETLLELHAGALA